MILLVILALVQGDPNMQAKIDELKDGIEDMINDLKLVKENLNYQTEVLSKFYEQSLGDVARETRSIGNKLMKWTGNLNKQIETEVLATFHRSFEEKSQMINRHIAYIDDKIDKKKVTSRIEKIVDIYWKRQQVPDPDLQSAILDLENKFGEISDKLNWTYNLDWLYIVLILLGVGVLLTWQRLQLAQKKHIID